MTRDEHGNIREVEPPKYHNDCKSCRNTFYTVDEDETQCEDCRNAEETDDVE